ncbi:hypothetical protein CONPUDRAFT_148863 [Coniophora puteana RWD-64-598 SS2]|uniref:Uncharacterized protein n=1 Tax=Coniophora puteana (strain RWD-64-598) TaxID=741705 RepID=A0A5M3N683_CONPW|nr:uncharacterized protein CONPUDRAFT_148863 [Coniophora puteana RWD-64-598 SS2]EIW86816.1 hypothetical protein CONPUDRAFT_148863 [Coniophora puteana RWD-64-598 SS2]
MFAKSLVPFNVALVALVAVWAVEPVLGRAVAPTPVPEMKRDWQSYGESLGSWGESVGSSWASVGSVIGNSYASEGNSIGSSWASVGSVVGNSYASEGYSIGLSDASTWLKSHSLQGTVTSVGSQLATVITSAGGSAITLAASGSPGSLMTVGGATVTVLAASPTSNAATSMSNAAGSPLYMAALSIVGGAAMGALLL